MLGSILPTKYASTEKSVKFKVPAILRMEEMPCLSTCVMYVYTLAVLMKCSLSTMSTVEVSGMEVTGNCNTP